MNYLTYSPQDIIKIADYAAEIARSFHKKDVEVNFKYDKSPVTNADILISDYIIKELSKLVDKDDIISEECLESAYRYNKDNFWLIDPIDGTNSYIDGFDEYTINIAHLVNRRPVFGLIHVPAYKEIYFNDFDKRAYKILANREVHEIKSSGAKKNYNLLVSTKYDAGYKMFEKLAEVKSITKMSSSLKFCKIAEGEFDAYPRQGPTMEWDVAAGDAILSAAGGKIINFDRSLFEYTKTEFKNSSFIAIGNKSF
jgi:3'(2'), 5'-bisphosphate nucleotidase